MVTLKVLPSFLVLPGSYVIWRCKEGKKFALRIGQKRRNMITRFIMENAIEFTPLKYRYACSIEFDYMQNSQSLSMTFGKWVSLLDNSLFLLISICSSRACKNPWGIRTIKTKTF